MTTPRCETRILWTAKRRPSLSSTPYPYPSGGNQEGGYMSRRLPVALLAMVVLLAALAVFLRSDSGLAHLSDNFEIDANHCNEASVCDTASGTTNYAKAGYYAGIQQSGDDWATQALLPAFNGTNDGAADCQPTTGLPGGAKPVFVLCNQDRTDLSYGSAGATCYNSRIDATLPGTAFICDGNSGGVGSEPELNIISSFTNCSDQKTNNGRWCEKTSGSLNNPSKSDETHGYGLIRRGVPCTTSTGSTVNHDFIFGGYERLSNSGTVFAGFVFGQKAPFENVVDSSSAKLQFYGTSTPVIDGRLDMNGDNAITTADDGTLDGVAIIDGQADIAAPFGTINSADDGSL